VGKTADTLEIDREDGFASRERHVQRAGIAILTVLVLLGAAGLFGDGPLSRAEARDQSLTVEYQRFTRQSARHVVGIDSGARGTQARIAFDNAFLQHYAIEEVRPPRVEIEDHGGQLVFIVPTTNGAARLELHLEALEPGVFSTRIHVEGGGTTTVRQIVFF
jgi:hypothetical protein